MKVVFGLLAAATFTAGGRSPLAHASPLPLAHESFIVGMLRVDHFGTAGRTPIIFIPALFCGASQWQRQIAALSDRYDIYAVTLPGFDARPRDTGGNLMSRATADISTLIRTKHLDHPIIVGHSLGGTLALLFAVHRSAEVRGIVSVEGGYPVAPTAERREESVREATAPYRGIARSAFGDSLGERMLQYVITSKSDADSVQAEAARSDPTAVIDWMSEALRLDLTEQLEEITVPVVEIVPFDSKIDPYQGFESAAVKSEAYRSFLAHAPHSSLVMIEHSRHFVMIDQPSAFDHDLYSAIDRIEGGA
jgi:pimeloyl-ACP methyl ester carboxylesterase